MTWHLRCIPLLSAFARWSSSRHTCRASRFCTGPRPTTASLRDSGASETCTPCGRRGWLSVSWREPVCMSSKCAPSLMSSRELTAKWRRCGRWRKVSPPQKINPRHQMLNWNLLRLTAFHSMRIYLPFTRLSCSFRETLQARWWISAKTETHFPASPMWWGSRPLSLALAPPAG